MGDRAHERADPAIVAAQFENFRHHRAILALELAGQARRRRDVGPLVDFDAQHAVRVGVRRAGHAAVERDERRQAVPAGNGPLGHLRDHADLRIAAAAPRDEQHARIAVAVRGQRDRHAGEHDHIVERNQFEGSHASEVTRNT